MILGKSRTTYDSGKERREDVASWVSPYGWALINANDPYTNDVNATTKCLKIV